MKNKVKRAFWVGVATAVAAMTTGSTLLFWARYQFISPDDVLLQTVAATVGGLAIGTVSFYAGVWTFRWWMRRD